MPEHSVSSWPTHGIRYDCLCGRAALAVDLCLHPWPSRARPWWWALAVIFATHVVADEHNADMCAEVDPFLFVGCIDLMSDMWL